MARRLSDRTNTDPVSPTNPYGAIRDESAPGQNDGTNVNEAVNGDMLVFFQRLMAEQGIIPNELPDNTDNGFQLYEALRSLIFQISGGNSVVANSNNNLPSTGGDQYLSVAFGNGIFVACKQNGTDRIATSPDGVNWTARTSADEGVAWQKVVFGNGTFVALGVGGAVMVSNDGINWANVTSVVTNAGELVYGNGTFVIATSSQFVGGSQYATSPDGVNWTARSGVEGRWRGATFGGGLFVLTATDITDEIIATSPDGITWTARTPSPSQQVTGALAVSYLPSAGRFVAIDNSQSWAYSEDGINWLDLDPGQNSQWSEITLFNGVLFAFATSGSGGFLAKSSDGLSWQITEEAALTNGGNLQQAISGVNLMVAVGSSGATAYTFSLS